MSDFSKITNTIPLTISLDKHNEKLYIFYKDLFFRELNGNRPSPSNINLIAKKINSIYNCTNPYDLIKPIEGISNEMKNEFEKNKLLLHGLFQKNIIEKVAQDILDGSTSIDSSFVCQIDKHLIFSQVKYLQTLNEHLYKKINIRGKILLEQILDNPISEEGRTILMSNIDYLDKQNELGRSPYQTIKNITTNLDEKLSTPDKQICLKSLNKLQNFFKSNLVKRKIEYVLQQSNQSIQTLLSSTNTLFTDILGLGNYAEQLSKFNGVLEVQNVKVSTNFFNENHDVFYNSYAFLYGWNMEELVSIKVKKIPEFQNVETQTINVPDWERISHFNGAFNIYIQEKMHILFLQKQEYEKDNDNITADKFHQAREFLKNTQTNISTEILQLYIKDPENTTSNLVNLLTETDKKIQEQFTTSQISSFLKEDEYTITNINTLGKDFNTFLTHLNQTIKIKNDDSQAILNPYRERVYKNYEKETRIPTMDLITYQKGGKIEEVFEIKTLSSSDQKIKIPFYQPFDIRAVENPFAKAIKEKNIEYLKEHQTELMSKQAHRLHKLNNLSITETQVCYIFNIIEDDTHSTRTFKIPLNAYENLFSEPDILDNSIISKTSSRKYHINIQYDFFKKYFQQYMILAPVDTNKTQLSKKP